MVRLVKGAYWDSEIKKSQERGLAGYPVYTRKVATDVSYLAAAQRLLDAGAVFLPAIRDPQRPHRRRDPRTCRRQPGLGIPAPARHGRSALRGDRRAGEFRPAVPGLCAGRQPRGIARLPRAPAARKRRQHLVCQSHRRRQAADRRDHRRPDRAAGAAAGEAASAHSVAARSLHARAQEFARDRSRRSPALDRPARRPRRRRCASPGMPRRSSAASSSPARRSRSSTRATSDGKSAPSSRPGRSSSTEHSTAPPTPLPAWDRRPADERAAILERAADLFEATAPS